MERFRRALLQLLEIFVRQIKPVGMIDAQPGDRALLDQLEEKPMGRIENLRQFHSDRRQIVHVEETSVIDFLRRHPPESEAISLVGQKRIERDRSCADRPACR